MLGTEKLYDNHQLICIVARKKTIETDTILEATRQVLLLQGSDATTAEIAKALDISEGTIFSRFKTKKELFLAAIRQVVQKDWVKEVLAARLLETETVDTLFRELASQGLGHIRKRLPLVFVSLTYFGSRMREMEQMKDKSPILRDTEHLQSVFEIMVKQGKLQACNTQVLANLFLGGLHSRVLLEKHVGDHCCLAIEAEFINQFCQTLLDSLRPSAITPN